MCGECDSNGNPYRRYTKYVTEMRLDKIEGNLEYMIDVIIDDVDAAIINAAVEWVDDAEVNKFACHLKTRILDYLQRKDEE